MRVCEYLNKIRQLQAENNNLILCGSAALILADIMPDREIGDLDFATTDGSTILKLSLNRDVYADEVLNGGYCSYSRQSLRQGFGTYKINVLLFNPETIINTETIKLPGGDIVCQRISDILYWKEKYNRKKDLIDLDAISLNMLEKAVFDKK